VPFSDPSLGVGSYRPASLGKRRSWHCGPCPIPADACCDWTWAASKRPKRNYTHLSGTANDGAFGATQALRFHISSRKRKGRRGGKKHAPRAQGREGERGKGGRLLVCHGVTLGWWLVAVFGAVRVTRGAKANFQSVLVIFARGASTYLPRLLHSLSLPLLPLNPSLSTGHAGRYLFTTLITRGTGGFHSLSSFLYFLSPRRR
jgi:hypothetical protein